MKASIKPRVFIASSAEGLEIARAIQQHLKAVASAVVWDRLVPGKLSMTVFEGLLQAAQSCDFGVFVFFPDDLITKRNELFKSARDNVVFELGLFTGRLGRERAFIVSPEETSDFRLPTDLLGHLTAIFDSEDVKRDTRAALKPASQSISEQIKRLGKFVPHEGFPIDKTELPYGSSLIHSKKIEGLWLSRFEYRTYRDNAFHDKFQFDIEYLKAVDDHTFSGENIAFPRVSKNNYQHQLEGRLYKNFLVGVWLNKNTENVGCFQLTVHSNRIIMSGRHLGNANDNSVQTGEWKWVKIANSEKCSAADIEDIRRNGKLKSEERLEEVFAHAVQNAAAIDLGEIQ